MHFIPITPALRHDDLITRDPFLQELVAATLAMSPHDAPTVPWCGWLAVRDGTPVGTCAFKTPPADGVAELAYFTFQPYEGQGVATAMAAHLVSLGRTHGLAAVTAQTMPAAGASTRILERLGFAKVGVVEHPEDGHVWEWRLALR